MTPKLVVTGDCAGTVEIKSAKAVAAVSRLALAKGRPVLEAEINPHAEEWEQAGIFPAHELFKKMGDQGLLGIHKPEKFGGQGLDYSYEMAFCEAIGNALRAVFGEYREAALD